MAQFTKVDAGNGTWRLRDERTGEFVARVWSTDVADRFLRDSQLVEDIAASLGLAATARRAAAVTAFQTWQAVGGRVVDLVNLSPVDDEGNRRILVNGADAGYFHGQVYDHARLLRHVRFGEKLWAARQLVNATEQRQATDAAIDELISAGGLG